MRVLTKTNNLFSVVIPIYNKGPHIHRSISSVLSQTCGDFELILIDDASSDNSLEEIQRFTDPRIRLFHRHQPGPGGYAARNLGIDKASGEWIAFLDADDEWHLDHLEKMHQLTREYPDVYLMGCGWKIEDGKESKDSGYFRHRKNDGNHILDAKAYLRACLKMLRPIHTSIACVRAASPVAPNLFPAEKGARRGGDVHAWLKMICHHKEMAWSAHVGARYFKDAVNMVTKTTPSSPCLMTKEVYREVSSGLDPGEQKLLRKYLNSLLKKAWMRNLHSNNPNFPLLPELFWSGDAFKALTLATMALTPPSFVRSLSNIKRSHWR
jgi:glycosyltransferase involved in cell wall biosynthesis